MRLAYLFNWMELNSPKYFPSTQQILDYIKFSEGLGHLIMGSILLSLGFPLSLMLFVCWLMKIDPVPSLSQHKNVYSGSIVMTFIGFLFSIIVLPQLYVNYLFQFDLTTVTRMEITAEDSKCPPLIISDQESIKQGLNWLKMAKAQPMSSKYFTGRQYSIQLSFTIPRWHYRYVMIYQYQTPSGQGKTIVPQLSADYKPSGGYDSTKFLDWLAENVDPHYQNCNP